MLLGVKSGPADRTIGMDLARLGGVCGGDLEPDPGVHLAVFSEEIVAGALRFAVPGLEGVVVPTTRIDGIWARG